MCEVVTTCAVWSRNLALWDTFILSLSVVQVCIWTCSDDEVTRVKKAFKKSGNVLRYDLGQKLKMKYVPTLTFEYCKMEKAKALMMRED